MIINQFKLRALELGLKLFYSDTDSLVLNGPLPGGMIDSATLGLLKLEHIITEGYFVAPKIYWLNCIDPVTKEEYQVTRCKGYPGNLTKEEIIALYEGRSINLTMNRWIRKLEDSLVQFEPPNIH